MQDDIPAQIARLFAMSRQQLLDLWHKLYVKSAPLGMRRESLVPFLAYRIQENAYGGLESAVRAELLRIRRSLEDNSSPAKKIVRRIQQLSSNCCMRD
jgi:hypothetical protein